MRKKTLRNTYVRDILDVVEGASLSIKTGSAYTGAGRYLHDSMIQWDVFNETAEGFIEVKGLYIYELITTGTVAKAPMEIRLFDFCSMLITKDNQFQLADDSTGNTTARNLKAPKIEIQSADYTEILEAGVTLTAVAYKQFPDPYIIKSKQNDGTLRAVAITTSAPTFDNSATLYIDLLAKVQ